MRQDVNNEQEFAELLEQIDSRIKALGKREGIASFHRLQGEPHEDMEIINNEVAAVLLDKTSRDAIETWKNKVTDPRLKRQAEVFSKAFLEARVTNDPELFNIADPLQKIIIEFQMEIDGEPVSRSDQGNILESEPDRDIRRKAYEAGKVLDRDIESEVLRLFDKRNVLARSLGYTDYVDLGLKLTDLDEGELTALFEDIRVSTQPFWDSVLADATRELRVDRLESWDLSYYMQTVLPAPPTERFPKDRIIPVFRETLNSAGGDLDALPIEVFERDIPYGGLCMGIEFGKDIRILTNPRDGLMWYDVLFHEFGHGIHSSCLDASSQLVAGGDPAFIWEGVAGMFEWIVHQKSFQTKHFGITEEEYKAISFRTRLGRVAWYRRIAVACLLEWSVYHGDPDPGKTLTELTEKYMGITIPTNIGWAGNTLYTTHPLYNQNYLLMDVLALHTIQAFRDKTGNYPGPELYDFVVDHYVKPAGWTTWREKILSATGKAMNADALNRYLMAE